MARKTFNLAVDPAIRELYDELLESLGVRPREKHEVIEGAILMFYEADEAQRREMMDKAFRLIRQRRRDGPGRSGGGRGDEHRSTG